MQRLAAALGGLRRLGSAARTGTDTSSRILLLHPASQGRVSQEEASRLCDSLVGAAPDLMALGSASQRLRPSPASYFGRGQVESAAARVAAVQPQRVVVNAMLSGVQQRTLERALGRPVLDRVGLIIEIFSQRARTREARLQVELASLEYRASRLVRVLDATTGKRTAFGLEGDTEIVSARERGRSGSSAGGLGGAGGQGESELQLQRRRVADRRRQLLRQLDTVRRTRAVQRAARQRSGKPQVALVGYTNAGKTSLLAALSHAAAGGAGGARGAGAGEGLEEGRRLQGEDRLFATLDPTLRRVWLPSGREVISSDTVGFISDLPHQLVEAFKATLEEVTSADLLLHVLDASSPQVLAQRSAVLGVLRELGVSEARLRDSVVEVWNKVDLLKSTFLEPAPGGAEGQPAAGEQAAQQSDQLEQQQQRRQPAAAGGAEQGSDGDSSTAGLHAAAAAGLLPPAVVALLQSDAAAAAYRPTAVATSALRGQGLQQVLEAVEAKLEASLEGRPQRSRKQAKMAAAEREREQALEDRRWLEAAAGSGGG